MSEEADIITKHLARNVPIDFSQVCQTIRQKEIYERADHDRRRYRDRSQHEAYARLYANLFHVISNDAADMSEVETCLIGQHLDEILIRFLAIQKTIDQSVPTKPIFVVLNRLKRDIETGLGKLHDPDRTATIEYLKPDTHEVTLDDVFSETNSLAEKVHFAERYLQAIEQDIDKMVRFFDYKMGLASRGNPSKYALVYAVFALAELFEQECPGQQATVNETVNDGRNGRPNARQYTGPFLEFVHAFLQIASVDMLQYRSIDGLNDQIRKLAKIRQNDPHIYEVLHGDEVTFQQVLQFMAAVDRIR